MSRLLRLLLLVTDVGFLTYWLVTTSHVLPAAWLFSGYGDPVVAAWNWSFLPLDLVVSTTGLSALYVWKTRPERGRRLLLVSLTATSISGLQAIAFWTLRRDFDLGWWLPNLFLLLWPLPFLATLLRDPQRRS